jgi:hypothetical protein
MKEISELAEIARTLAQEMPEGTVSMMHIFYEVQEIGMRVKYCREALAAIEAIVARRGIGDSVKTILKDGTITVYIQEMDLRIWLKIE